MHLYFFGYSKLLNCKASAKLTRRKDDTQVVLDKLFSCSFISPCPNIRRCKFTL